MKRWISLGCALMLLLPAVGFAQEHGRLIVTVQTNAEPPSPSGKVIGAKVIVVHWTNAQLYPAMIQDQVATTNQMGSCTIDLPPGTYDIFISAKDLAPSAMKRDIQAGESTPLVVTLRPAPMHLRPIN